MKIKMNLSKILDNQLTSTEFDNFKDVKEDVYYVVKHSNNKGYYYMSSNHSDRILITSNATDLIGEIENFELLNADLDFKEDMRIDLYEYEKLEDAAMHAAMLT
mgnify:CR=1 FL=1